MTTKETAIAFTELLKAGAHREAAEKFNAPDIASYEPMEGPMAVCRGAEAVKAKSDWWYANHETTGGTIEGPFVHGDQFVVKFAMDITVKATGEKMSMTEAGLYTLRDGKIVEERFFF